ncbi:MAG: serine/threonine-protein kinase [Gemmatimonadota bacterium]
MTESTLEERLGEELAPHLLVVREIGAGGMARVFLAREPALKRHVAIKVLATDLSADAGAKERFTREAQAVAGLSHPHVVSVFRVGELRDGTPYFVMQHVAGTSLQAHIAEHGPLSIDDARRVIAEVASALAFTHEQRLIHRDIKPANVLYEAAIGRALVSDFGIAAVSATPGTSMSKLTQTGAVLGTPQYMSPEQLLAEPVSDKTDVYSLGILAFEVITGTRPFEGATHNEIIAAHLRDLAPRVSTRRAEVPSDLDLLVARCLEKDPGTRPTAGEVVRRLAPGAPSILEWPAPGLEPVQGQALAITALSWAGTLLVLLVLGTIVFGSADEAAGGIPIRVLLSLAGAAGMLLLGNAARRLTQTARCVSPALRSGYAWHTLLETFFDTTGDTGALLTGTGRFSTLTASSQRSLRTRRLTGRALLLLGGTCGTPLVAFGVLLGARGIGTSRTLAVLMAMVLTTGLIGLALTAAERLKGWRTQAQPDVKEGLAALNRRKTLVALLALLAFIVSLPPTLWLGPTLGPLATAVAMLLPVAALLGWEVGRARRARVAAGFDAAVSRAWYRSLSALDTPAMRVLGVRLNIRLITLTLDALLLAVALLLAPTLVGHVFGWRYLSGSSADLVVIRNLLIYEEIAADSKSLAAPTDPTIPALDAGRALYALDKKFDTPIEGHPLPERPVDRLPDLPRSANPKALVDALNGRLTTDELSHAEAVAHSSVWRSFTLVARAASVDYIGARFVLPWPDEIPLRARFPVIYHFGILNLNDWNAERAAYFVATGRADSAEAVLREGVSFGLSLARNGILPNDVFQGFMLAQSGRVNVRNYCAAPARTGTPLRSSSLCAKDRPSALGGYSARNDPTFSEATLDRAEIRSLIADDRLTRAVRLRLLRLLALASCGSTRELVYGSKEQNADLGLGLRTLARSPADSALIHLVFARPDLFAMWTDSGSNVVSVRLAMIASGMFRIPRLAHCAISLG